MSHGNAHGACFEAFTWAAGVGGATEHAAMFATSHVPTIHPIAAAKQATTIDQTVCFCPCSNRVVCDIVLRLG